MVAARPFSVSVESELVDVIEGWRAHVQSSRSARTWGRFPVSSIYAEGRVNMRRLSVALVVCSMLMVGMASALAATHVELFASLHGSKAFPQAHGSSTYERTGTSRDVKVTVQSIKSLAGKKVTLYVAGKKVGKILVTAGGTATGEFSTAQGDKVPFSSAGSRVKVRTASGTLVASGTYHKHHS
jgi:FlaG/FlaF family flagellin (archaellin)